MPKRIVIVGAGPVGCYLGQLLKQRGISPLLIEEHAQVGRPLHCAGLVSGQTVSESKVSLPKDVVLNRIDGAYFIFDGRSFKITRHNVAVVINREQFDYELSKGLQIKFNTPFVGIEKEKGGYIVNTDKENIYADILVGADGANSAVRRCLGTGEEVQLLKGVQFRIRQAIEEPNFVRVYLLRKYFAWIIPESSSVVRAGIISDNPYHDLSSLLKDAGYNGQVIETFGGLVPLGRCITKKDNVVLVGDAACQVKPLTHGGIYYGMRCAEILADCIACDKLNEYEKRWEEKFYREIETGFKIKRFYQQLNQEELRRFFDILEENAQLIQELGDFENHSRAIAAIMRNPKLQLLMGRLFLELIKKINIF